MTITKSKQLATVINDWVFFLLAIPVVSLLILTEQFGMLQANLKCFQVVNILKSRQSAEASEWSVRHHLIRKDDTKCYDDIF